MPSTVTIDDGAMLAVHQIADCTGGTLGHALSELARASLTRRAEGMLRNGAKLVPMGTGARATSLEDVNAPRDESPTPTRSG